MRLFTSAVLACLAAVSGCSTKISTRHVANPGPVLEDQGVHYYLPRTVIRASIPVVETTTTRGTYADLTPFFFPHVPASQILNRSATYEIDPKRITLTARGIRDPKHHYVVNPTGRWWADTIFTFNLGPDGIVNKFDVTVENRSVDIALTAVEVAAGLAAKALVPPAPPAAAKVADLEKARPWPAAEYCVFAPSTSDVPARNIQVDMSRTQQHQYENVVVPRYRQLYCHLFPEHRDVVFEDGWIEVLLEYAAQEIGKLREDPTALRKASGLGKVTEFLAARAAVTELVALQRQAERLNENLRDTSVEAWRAQQEARTARTKEILGQFFGAKKQDPDYALAVFDIDPNEGVATEAIALLSLSATEGICDVDDTRAVASPPRATCTQPGDDIELRISHALGSVAGAASAVHSGETGIRYRVPARGDAVVWVVDKTKKSRAELGRAVIDVAQFGAVAALPQKTGGLKTQYTVQLDPATGALRDITVGNKGLLTNEVLTRAGKVAESGIDTRRAMNPPSPAAPSAQEVAEKERKLKEEQLRIRLLDECLKDPAATGCADLIKK